MKERKIIYYEDELTDEFSDTVLKRPTIDDSYQYCHTSLTKRFTRFFWYRIVATPIAFLYTKIAFGHKIIGMQKLKTYRKTGYFIYGNHTQDVGDALMPNMIDLRKEKYIVVNPANLNAKIVGKITPSLGALPLPDTLKAGKNFMAALQRRISEGAAIVIYPEAHIWPYYTDIRPFADSSFSYPVKLSSPVFCFTNTYQKRRRSKKARILTYVDGPFFPNPELSPREARQELRNRVYKKMKERATLSNIKIIEYVKKEKTND